MVEDIEPRGGKAITIQADAIDASAVGAAVAKAVETFVGLEHRRKCQPPPRIAALAPASALATLTKPKD